MISEIIDPEQKSGISLFNLPVMVIDKKVDRIVLLNEFFQNDDGDFAYHGYTVNHNGNFSFAPYVIYDNVIENWTKFDGKVVLSNG